MSEQKGRIYASSVEKIPCVHCGGTLPWHFRDCILVKDRMCLECQALWPRHYPHCSRDVLGFSRWWVPRGVQKELIELYRAAKVYYEHKHGRLPIPADDGLDDTPAREQYVRPDIARELLGDIVRWLAAKHNPKLDGQKLKQEIHAKIDAIASGKESAA